MEPRWTVTNDGLVWRLQPDGGTAEQRHLWTLTCPNNHHVRVFTNFERLPKQGNVVGFACQQCAKPYQAEFPSN